jgi:hypothetical protein
LLDPKIVTEARLIFFSGIAKRRKAGREEIKAILKNLFSDKGLPVRLAIQ